MSSSALYRNPTWISLFPRKPTPVPAPREARERLMRLLPGPGTLARLDYEGRAGTHFVFEGAQRGGEAQTVGAGGNGERLFLKLVGEAAVERQVEADAISAWLAGQGVSCVTPTAGFPKNLENGRRLFAYPYLECEPLEACDGDVARLGRELAGLHEALRRHPSRPAWEDATRARLTHLVEIRRGWAAGAYRLGPRPDELTEMARDTRLDFERSDLEATPLHGDLNAGNLRRLGCGRPLLLDFEDTFHSVLPCPFELGLVFERIVLVAADDDREAARLLGVLLGAYRNSGGRIPPAVDWRGIVRSLSLRSLCVITSCELAGVAIDAGEWLKFFQLAEAAAARPAAFAV
jgi:hypothetical protein